MRSRETIAPLIPALSPEVTYPVDPGWMVQLTSGAAHPHLLPVAHRRDQPPIAEWALPSVSTAIRTK